MSENKMSNPTAQIFRTGGILCAITAVSALLLAAVNSVTAPVIDKNETAKMQAAMNNVMSAADSFEEIEFTASEDCESVDKIYAAKKGGETVGWCVSASPNGYGGAINMMVGIDKNMLITGVDIISQSETAGLGSKSTEPEFREQYIGKGRIEKVVKSGAGEDEIDAITSATITSKAVTKGVNEAITASELFGK